MEIDEAIYREALVLGRIENECEGLRYRMIPEVSAQLRDAHARRQVVIATIGSLTSFRLEVLRELDTLVMQATTYDTCKRCGQLTGVPERHEIFCRQREEV